MEPPRGIWSSFWNFIWFLPYFTGLLILGFIKGIVLCPVICLIMTIGNSAIILGLWPVHCLWTYYCFLRSKQFGPVLRLVFCLCITVPLLLWPLIGILASIIGGAAYGLLSPVFATFDAVGEGKDNEFFHCIYDGTWDTVTGCFTIIRDFADCCFHSYFSIMDDLRNQEPKEGKYYEIRVLYIPGAIIIGVLGILVDFLVISLVALCKFPYMLFKGWHRLFQDCIGREGPFLETICVPFAGLAILLWPLAVAGALLASIVSSIFLGAYAAVIVYQESSFWFGLCYIVASLSIYDEYSNDILDMSEGSCFPRPKYRKKAALSQSSSFQKPDSIRKQPSRQSSLRAALIEVKPLELIDNLFKECQRHGEIMVSEGLITLQEIIDARSNKNNGKSICTGLAAYGILQSLLRSAKANSAGILLADNVTEITSTNRPKDTFFDWFLNPLLIIKDQIKALNLSQAEEDYLGKLVLLSGDHERLKNSNIGSPPISERKQAELNGLARRLQGITKSISRFPTYRRRIDNAIKTICEEIARKSDTSKQNDGPQTIPRSQSTFARIFSQKSFKNKTLGADLEAQPDAGRDIRIE